MAESRSEASPEAIASAKEAVYVAEGSDWFWWYGEQFSTDYAYEFDTLFRAYLHKVYENIGRPVPESLAQPIKRVQQAAPAREPVGFIQPEIDGRLSFYWEWAGAGEISPDGLGSMHRGESALSTVRYGFNLSWFFLRLDPQELAASRWRTGATIEIDMAAARHINMNLINAEAGESEPGWHFRAVVDGEELSLDELGIRCAIGDIIEIAVPFAMLGVGAGETFTFSVAVLLNDIVVKRWPREGFIKVQVPDEDFEKKLWLV